MSAWQPIDTAPKDGSEVMLYDPRFRRFKIGSWRVDDYATEFGEVWLDDSHDDFSTGFASCPIQPTHWMPLPEAPE